MKWAITGPLASLDTETTDKNPHQARVLDIALALIVPGRDLDLRTGLINPGVPIPAESTAVHGITDEQVQATGKPPVEVLDLFVADIASAVRAGFGLVVQNAAYDLTVLRYECDRHGLPTIEDRIGGPLTCVVDPMVLDRYAIKYRKRVSEQQGARVLKTLAAVYGVPWDDTQAHGAAYDALIGARVTWRMAQWACKPRAELMGMRVGPFDPPKPMHRDDAAKFLTLGGMSLPELHAAEVGWYREQAESLAQYWRQQANQLVHDGEVAESNGDIAASEQAHTDAADLLARADSINTAWPIQPLTEVTS